MSKLATDTTNPSPRHLLRLISDIGDLKELGQSALPLHWNEANSTYGSSTDGEFRVSNSCFVVLYHLAANIFPDNSDQVIVGRLQAVDFAITTPGLRPNNVYSAAIFGATCRAIGLDPETSRKGKKALANIRDALEDTAQGGVAWTSHAGGGTKWESSGFLTYWSLRSLGDFEADDRRRAIALAWCRGEVYRQIVLTQADESELSDAMQLGYCLAACLRYGVNLPRSTVEAAFAAIFKQQAANGAWTKGAPILPVPLIGTLDTFAAEMFAVLFEDSQMYWDSLEVFLPHLTKFVDWLKLTHHEPSGTDKGGWQSNHLPRGTSQAWATATVAWVTDVLQRVVMTWLTSRAREEFETRVDGKDALDRLWDSTVVSHGEQRSLNEIIYTKIIEPVRGGIETRAALLFGPPGTAKTSLAKGIAFALGYPLLTVSIGDFLTEGSDSVARRAREIFNLLTGISRCVVLFDEVEELIRARDDQHSERESRLLTTALLPYFQELRRARNLVLVATTNNLGAIDDAASRFGRFDMVLPIGPPSPAEKERHLVRILLGRIETTEVRRILDEKAMTVERATYAEWDSLLRSVPDTGVALDLAQKLDELGEELQISAADWEQFKTQRGRLPLG